MCWPGPLRQWSLWLAGDWTDSPGDVLIVPGADEQGEGYLGVDSFLRANYAVRAWRGGGFRRVYLSGARVAAPMRDYLIGHGVPAPAIEVEDQAESTRENATLLAPRLRNETGRLVLLTSDYHMRRAAAVFAKQGVPVSRRPIPHALKLLNNPLDRIRVGAMLAAETVKLVYYQWQGWI